MTDALTAVPTDDEFDDDVLVLGGTYFTVDVEDGKVKLYVADNAHTRGGTFINTNLTVLLSRPEARRLAVALGLAARIAESEAAG